MLWCALLSPPCLGTVTASNSPTPSFGSSLSASPTTSPVAPVAVVGAALSATANDVLITFNVPMDMVGNGLNIGVDTAVGCDTTSPALFPADTLAVFGAGARCYWASPTVLTGMLLHAGLATCRCRVSVTRFPPPADLVCFGQ